MQCAREKAASREERRQSDNREVRQSTLNELLSPGGGFRDRTLCEERACHRKPH